METDFRRLVKTKTNFKGNPVSYSHDTGLTARYRKFIKEQNGRVPMPRDYLYNPKTQRIVLRNKFVRTRTRTPTLKSSGKKQGFDIISGDGFYYLSNEVEVFNKKLSQYNDEGAYPNGIPISFYDYSPTVLVKMIQTLALSENDYVVIAGGVYYIINDKNANKLVNAIVESSESQVITEGSDGEIITAIKNYDSFVVKKWDGEIKGLQINDDEEEGKSGVNQMGFFPFYHTIDGLDLSRYGIYRQDQEKNYDNCCLVEAIQASGRLTEGKINILKQKVINRFINQRELEDFAKGLNGLVLEVKRVDTQKQQENEKDGKRTNTAKNHIYPKNSKSKEKIKIGMVAGHAFHIDNQTGITGWALRNYGTKAFKSFHQYTARGQTDPSRAIDSYKLIDYLYLHRDKFLVPITKCDEIYGSVFYDKITEFSTLEYEEGQYGAMGKFLGGSTKNIEYKSKKAYRDRDIKKGNRKPKTAKIFFDFETDVYEKRLQLIDDDYTPERPTTTQHTPYIVCMDTYPEIEEYCKSRTDWRYKKHWYKSYERKNKDIAYDFLEYLYEWFGNQDEYELELYAHNLGYDFRFLAPYIVVDGGINIEKGTSQIITTTAKFLPYGKRKTGSGFQALKITFFDTLALIPTKLSQFGKMFELKTKKEILPYEMYNNENIKQRYLPIDKCLSYIKNTDDHEEFLQNCEDWGCYHCDRTHIDIIKYSIEYCKMDCVVLRDGYDKFRALIMEATGLDSQYYLTLPSIASDYLKKEGCFDGCYSLAGIPRDFIADSAWGGRVMTKNNEKQIVDFRQDHSKTITDLDEVSQYPSSMARMEGFVKGCPKIITEWKNDGMDYDMFYVRIEIIAVVKRLNFPLLNERGKGSVNWTNNMVGKRMTVDKYSLMDLLFFHKIQYKFINGYYFDEGFNPTINETIRKLFYSRFQAKNQIKKIGGDDTSIRKIPLDDIKTAMGGSVDFDEWIKEQYDSETEEIYKNPLQEVYKLLMNSAYGKMLLKPIDTSLHYVRKGKLRHHYNKFHHQIKCMEASANGCYAKITHYEPIDTHFNEVHIGANVLSIAKRMMMEVMTIGEELDMSPEYTDTDSIQIIEQYVEPIKDEYNSRFGKYGNDYYVLPEMLGEDLGQFNLDIDIKGCRDVVSRYAIWLGKKCYIHKLEGINKKTNQPQVDYHIRMKGVPADSIKWKSKSEYENDIMRIYEDLHSDEAVCKTKQGEPESGIIFDLLRDKNGDTKVRFEFNGDMTITSKQEFLRRIRFPNKI